MDYPILGQNVNIVYDDGTEDIGYWNGDIWMQGVDNDPNDIEIIKTVVSWSYR
jgi:hypothetical protein